MKMPDRFGIIHGVLILFALALIGKAGYEQLYRHSYWTEKGRRHQFVPAQFLSPRGEILDETGVILVESRALVHLRIAPVEIKHPKAFAALARDLRNLHVDEKWVKASIDPTRKWVEIPGLFKPEDVTPLLNIDGVHPAPATDRVYANSAGIRRIVGRVGRDGKPLDGVESALNDILKGDTGRVLVAQDKRGRALGAPDDTLESGKTVVLTINQGLQDICERAIADAVDSMHATGGDIVIMNPHTGDILAMASKRIDPAAVANTAVTEPYEPGSTVKPFVAAELLETGRAKPDEVINTYGGHFEIDGRKINDAEEHEAMMSLTDVIKHSSNVGIVRFAQRLTPREKYELYRNIGFGTPTMVPLTGESPGTLTPVPRWSKQTQTSIMMGYELTVTPLQLVTAYSAIANGGLLLEPHLVKEVRAPNGDTLYEARPRVIRRVMRPEVATEIQKMLREVVTGGTSTKADLATLDVAGKSGTALRTNKGHYEAGAYTASFAGIFPVDHPQLVILAKLDKPQNGYYGGVVAGNVANQVFRAALSARDAALDLPQLAASVHAPRPDTSVAGRAAEKAAAKAKARADSIRAVRLAEQHIATPADTDPRTSASYVIKLPSTLRIAPIANTVRAVPDIAGLPLRAAARTLHAAGFRVQVVPGMPPGTDPVAGTMLTPGRVVKLSAEQ